ncbi:hypothetical protein BFW38_06175 [Terasakiispira papahanaumokuakeensis]|uniref:Uncharacterized protein n=1 Tax=Terasakiispira papahanaumokuakeensis TaxID=197479 RepID=A0A1E2V886_9GAMM|nr:DUF4145 domain-containing protein [Terasakiispira papahanaumokuakeensis]ODC03191.1 hypothetical protein BFW38_06175 [Terasakiispira papahanaumokuakeensis]
MKIENFSKLAMLSERTELEKVELLAYYLSENKQESEFTISDVSSFIFALGFAKPNQSRLKNKVIKSKSFVKGSAKDTYRLSVKKLEQLRDILPKISEAEEIVSDDSILPEVLLQETKRPYLIKLAQQINASYENNLFDACSLMMRRLLEVLLIHAFEKAGIEGDVKDSEGNYQNLKTLINKAISRPEINISNDVKKDIDKFRELGNLSAHRVKYNCRRDDIRTTKLEYRATIEELLYASGLVAQSS